MCMITMTKRPKKKEDLWPIGFHQTKALVFGDAFGAMNGGKRQLQLIVLLVWVEN
jgi:hypothetical protein